MGSQQEQVGHRNSWPALPIVATDGGMRNRRMTLRARVRTLQNRHTAQHHGAHWHRAGQSGEMLVVSAIVNHENAKGNVARPIVDAIVEDVLNRN